MGAANKGDEGEGGELWSLKQNIYTLCPKHALRDMSESH